MKKSLQEYFSDFDFREAYIGSIIQVVNGVPLPKDYLDFLTEHNGGEGAVGDNTYMQLFSLEELEQINRDYSVKEFLPDDCLIGSSMGGEFYGISKEGVYFAVPDIPMCEEEKVALGNSFGEFIEELDRYMAQCQTRHIKKPDTRHDYKNYHGEEKWNIQNFVAEVK